MVQEFLLKLNLAHQPNLAAPKLASKTMHSDSILKEALSKSSNKLYSVNMENSLQNRLEMEF